MQQMQVEDNKCMSPVFIVKVINLFRYPVNSIREQEHELSCTLHPSTADRAFFFKFGQSGGRRKHRSRQKQMIQSKNEFLPVSEHRSKQTR